MPDTTHLVSLQSSLSREKARLSAARKPSEIALRRVWVAQLEKEIIAEYTFLGMTPPVELDDMNDDDLLAELGL